MKEINVVIVHTPDGDEVCAFTDRDRALDWYSRFKKVSIHAVEVDSIEAFTLLHDELKPDPT